MLCPWCLLITVTTTLVFGGITRINIRDGVIAAPASLRRIVAQGLDWALWGLIVFGVLIVYENIIMEMLNEVLWRWGRDSVAFRAFYLVMDRLPDVVACVAFILCGVWLVRGPRKPKAAPAPEEAAESDESADFREYHADADDTAEEPTVLTLPEAEEPDEEETDHER